MNTHRPLALAAVICAALAACSQGTSPQPAAQPPGGTGVAHQPSPAQPPPSQEMYPQAESALAASPTMALGLARQDTGASFKKHMMNGHAGKAAAIAPMPPIAESKPAYYQDEGRDKFQEIKANPVKLAKDEPVSTF